MTSSPPLVRASATKGFTSAPRQLLDLNCPAPFEFSNLLSQIRQPGMTSFAH
jgi:hypothetical protein